MTLTDMKRQKRAGNPTQAVAYIRVSTEDQHLGTEAQRAAITRWATLNGVTVVEWHEAGSAEERIKRGICMSWRRPRPEDVDCDEVVEKVQDLFEPGTGDEDSKGNSTPANDEGSDDDSDEDETQDVLNASAVLQDALVEDAFTAQLGSISASISQQDVRPKLEFVEDRSALSVAQNSVSGGPSGMQVDSQSRTKDKDAKEDPRNSQKDASKPDEPRGLKATSHNPVFGAVAGPSHSNNKVPNSKTKSSRSSAYTHLREEIVYSDLNLAPPSPPLMTDFINSKNLLAYSSGGTGLILCYTSRRKGQYHCKTIILIKSQEFHLPYPRTGLSKSALRAFSYYMELRYQ